VRITTDPRSGAIVERKLAMALDRDDFDAPKPRRKRPGPVQGEGAAPGGEDEGYSTFRPSPVGEPSTRNPKRAGSSVSKPLRDRPYVSHGAEFEVPASGPTLWERILFGRVSTGQLAQFCRQFASYLSAGIDFNRSLSSLQKQFSRTALGPILGRVHVAIQRGSTLEEAMAKEPQAFGPMFLNMIKVAEARGGVPETLRMMGHHYESRQRLIRQARTAMIYPVIVLAIASVVVALITIFLLPKFAGFLKEFAGNVQLPVASQILMGISSFVQVIGWWLIPLVMIATPIALVRAYKTSAGKSVMDRIALRLPVLGKLCRMLDMTRFARTLSVLLDAGVDIASSIDLTADVLRMTPIRNAVRSSRPEIIAGGELSTILERSREFMPDVIAVMTSGEETGRLPEALVHLADDYDEQVSVMVASLGHLVQPIMMVLLGGIVLFIILAVFMPLIQMITTLAAP
jgi:type IV pilus assembly protein PilC